MFSISEPTPAMTLSRLLSGLLIVSALIALGWVLILVVEVGVLVLLLPAPLLLPLLYAALAVVAAIEVEDENFRPAYLCSFALLLTAYWLGTEHDRLTTQAFIQPAAVAGGVLLILTCISTITKPRKKSR